MLIAHDAASSPVIRPGTPSWVKARIGMLTGSRMASAMRRLKSGGESAARLNLRYELLSERLTDISTDHYVTDAMQWGLDHEMAAREAYCEMSGNVVMDAGFVLHPTIEFFGATPDGLIHHDGVAEFKCPTSKTHTKWMRGKSAPNEYKPQMVSEIICTRRKWCDFVSFDPRMPTGQRLLIFRYTPTEEEIIEVENAAIAFLDEIESMFRQVTEDHDLQDKR